MWWFQGFFKARQGWRWKNWISGRGKMSRCVWWEAVMAPDFSIFSCSRLWLSAWREKLSSWKDYEKRLEDRDGFQIPRWCFWQRRKVCVTNCGWYRSWRKQSCMTSTGWDARILAGEPQSRVWSYTCTERIFWACCSCSFELTYNVPPQFLNNDSGCSFCNTVVRGTQWSTCFRRR